MRNNIFHLTSSILRLPSETHLPSSINNMFNSNNTRILNLEETKEKIASLQYIQNELNGIPNLV